jgi:hypothetical protein
MLDTADSSLDHLLKRVEAYVRDKIDWSAIGCYRPKPRPKQRHFEGN